MTTYCIENNCESYIVDNDTLNINDETRERLHLGVDFGKGYNDAIQYFNKENHENTTSSIYTDRMFSWDSEKFNRCAMEVFGNKGQYFYANNRKKNDVEKFLSLYLEKDCQITAIIRYENRATSYPTWRIDYIA